jgi:AsmA protein
MKIWLKRVLFSLVAFFIVAIVGIAIFLLTFDPNAYKNKLEEVVYKRYHRSLEIKGDIELSLFPRIGLSVQDVSLSDRDSTDTFASIDSARFAVAIWPLMSNRLVVDHVAVSGFKAWVIRDRDGNFNFSDLVRPQAPTVRAEAPSPRSSLASPVAFNLTKDAQEDARGFVLPAVLRGDEAPGPDFQIDIAGLDLKNGEIHVYDNVTGAVARVVQLDVNTGRMTFNQAFDVALKGRLLGDYPMANASLEGQAVVRLDPEQKTYSAQRLNVQMKGKLGNLDATSATLRGNLGYSVYSQMLSASSLELLVQGALAADKPIKNLSVTLAVPQLKVDRSQSELRVEKLAFRSTGQLPAQAFDIAFDAPGLSISPEAAKGDPISGTIKLSGARVLGVSLNMNGLGGDARNLTLKELKIDSNLKEGERLVKTKISSPASWNVFEEKGSLSAMKGDIRIEDAALPGGSFEFPLIGSLHADLIKDELVSDINAVLSGSQLEFRLKATQLGNPKVVFDLAADRLDFNTMFPAAATAPIAPAAGGASSARAAASPSAPEAPKTEKAVVAPAAPTGGDAFDLAFLRSVDVAGNIKIGELKVRDFQAKEFSAAARAVDGKLEISNLAAQLYGGTLAGTLSAQATNQLAGQLTFDKVYFQPLFQGFGQPGRLSGQGSLKMNLKTQGATAAALKADLSGTVEARVRDGALQGINVAQTLRELSGVVRNVWSGQVPDMATRFDQDRQTGFDMLDVDLVLERGQGSVKKLSLAAPLLRVSQGQPASFDIVNNQLDVMIDARVVSAAAAKDSKELSELKGVIVPVRLYGPFERPRYQVQWKDIGSQVVKQAVEDGLIELLSNKANASPLPADTPTATEQAPPEKPVDPVKRIGDALKGLFGQ